MSDIMTSTGLRKPPTASCTDWNGDQCASSYRNEPATPKDSKSVHGVSFYKVKETI